MYKEALLELVHQEIDDKALAIFTKVWGYWGPLSEHRERTRLERHGNEGIGPMCRCGSRNTARIGDSALTRQCQVCGQTYAYRLKDGILVPHSLETALALEGR